VELPDDDDLVPAGSLDTRTAALQATVAAVGQQPCARCGAALCGHAALLAVVTGYKHRPHCPACLSAALHDTVATVAERAWQWISRRDCFLHVWTRATANEGHGAVDRPPCLFPSPTAPMPPAPPLVPAHSLSRHLPAAAGEWNAGDLGCGDLVLELRTRLRELPPGAVLHVTATDPAAPVDLPAWCGLCGHTLVHASHPEYFIQRKRD
jgi:tRNA 2-thiouridine synthesizing protein A